jgi:RNA polymerase-interacting CarD/CdnL/TRCF family regulator
METLIFVLGVLCGAVFLGIAYVLRELLRVKEEIKSLKKNKYVYHDRFSSLEEEIIGISEKLEISMEKMKDEIRERGSQIELRIEEVRNKSWENSDRMYQDLHRRIDKEVMSLNSIVDSRINKLENKFIKFDLLHPSTEEIKSKR